MTDGRKRGGTAVSLNAWTKVENIILRRYYPDPKTSMKQLQEMLPLRSEAAIYVQASKALGLHRRRTTKCSDLKIIKRLWDLREREGIERRQLAERMGYSHLSLERWETGQAMPTVRRLIDWCEALGAELTVAYKGTPIEPTNHDDDDFEEPLQIESAP